MESPTIATRRRLAVAVGGGEYVPFGDDGGAAKGFGASRGAVEAVVLPASVRADDEAASDAADRPAAPFDATTVVGAAAAAAGAGAVTGGGGAAVGAAANRFEPMTAGVAVVARANPPNTPTVAVAHPGASTGQRNRPRRTGSSITR
jgi:hypothetical protein